MPDSQTENIQDVFCNVIDNLAFMFGDPVAKEELPATVEDCTEAAIGFSGPSSGRLVLAAPQHIAVELAMNLLGLEADDEPSEETAVDALGELMNVTLGQLITTLCGTEAVFDLTVPEVTLRVDADRWAQMLHDDQSVGFIVETYPVLLRLTTNPNP